MQRNTNNAVKSVDVEVPTSSTDQTQVHLTLVEKTTQSHSVSRRKKLTKEEAVREAMLRTG